VVVKDKKIMFLSKEMLTDYFKHRGLISSNDGIPSFVKHKAILVLETCSGLYFVC